MKNTRNCSLTWDEDEEAIFACELLFMVIVQQSSQSQADEALLLINWLAIIFYHFLRVTTPTSANIGDADVCSTLFVNNTNGR
jgi:hypothetical protein